MIYFTAHTFKCVCHCRRAMFRVLGMYNFAQGEKNLRMTFWQIHKKWCWVKTAVILSENDCYFVNLLNFSNILFSHFSQLRIYINKDGKM